jgi:hypothetical protein
LETILQAGLLPTAVLTLLAFLARTQLETIQVGIRTVSTELKELNEKVGGHGEELSGVKARLDALERDVHGILNLRRGRR